MCKRKKNTQSGEISRVWGLRSMKIVTKVMCCLETATPEGCPHLGNPWKSTGEFMGVIHLDPLPSGKLTVCYWKWPFIVDFPIKNGGSFHSYVSLPEGRKLRVCFPRIFFEAFSLQTEGFRGGKARQVQSHQHAGPWGCWNFRWLKGWGQNPKWNKMKWEKICQNHMKWEKNMPKSYEMGEKCQKHEWLGPELFMLTESWLWLCLRASHGEAARWCLSATPWVRRSQVVSRLTKTQKVWLGCLGLGGKMMTQDPASVLHNSSWFNKWLQCIKIPGVRGSKLWSNVSTLNP